MRRTWVLMLPCLLALPAAAGAQADGETAFRDAENVVEDIGWVWSSPARMEAGDLEAVGAMVGITALIALVDGPIQELVREYSDDLPLRLLDPVREPSFLSTLGLSKRLLTLSAGLWAAGLVADSRDLRDAGTGCIVSDVSNTIVRHLIARAISRARPQEGRGPYHVQLLGLGEWEMRSFPGGHGANITACTTFWTRRFDLGAAEPVMWAFAGSVAFARILDEAHWASDAAFGVMFGYAIGKTVADRYLDRLADDDALPALDGGPALRVGITVPIGNH